VRRRAALLSLSGGLVVIVVSQLIAPLGSPPLYDGVVVQDPYRYLVPGPGQVGEPTSFLSPLPVDGTTSPRFIAATSESPPQAELIAPPGAFVVGAGVTTLAVSIDPVEAPAPPSAGTIAGNVYRFAVADRTGVGLAVTPATVPTLILRAPDGVIDATIARNSGGTWQELPTEPAGQPGIFLTNVSELGDFALIATSESGLLGLDQRLVVGSVIAATVAVVVLGFLVSRSRRRPVPVPRPLPPRRPRPSKRGRSGRRRGGSR
jgi:hypothetical protein